MSKTPDNVKMVESLKLQAGASAEKAPGDSAPPLDEALGSSRRGFMSQAGTVLIGAAAVSPALAAATSASMNPIRGIFKHGSEKEKSSDAHASSGGKTYRVASREQFTENGPPQMFSIVDDMMDGWVLKKDVSIGAVWVQRLDGDNFRAFQAICPHAGCPVMYEDGTKQFYCPCHVAHFQLDGARLDGTQPNPSKRDLDSLEVVVTDDGSVVVTFQRFKEGAASKIAEG